MEPTAPSPSCSSPACEGRRHRGSVRRFRTLSSMGTAALVASVLVLLLLLPGRAAAFLVGPGPAARARRPTTTGRLFAESESTSPSSASESSSPSSSRREALQRISAGVAGALLGGSVLAGGGMAARALEPQSYMDQLREAMPVKTIRGIWRIREYRDGETLCKGRLKMKGFVEEPNKGTLEYTGCNDGKGRGNWLLKPARIDNGQIRFSARWKVRFSDGDSLIYRGDVLAGGNYAKATATITKGEILKPVTGITGNLTERRIGSFEADLIEPSDDEEKL